MPLDLNDDSYPPASVRSESRDGNRPAESTVVIEDLLRGIASSLVDHPAALEVATFTQAGISTFLLRVDPRDIGQLIGKHGRTARSIRTLLNGMGNKLGMRFLLDIPDIRAELTTPSNEPPAVQWKAPL